jgi:membrane peptidoglycan carboxypeptidase
VIVKSSNVGAIKVGLQVGRERMGAYVRRFGFGTPVSPDFPGESPGIVWEPSKLNDSALASVSMGYQVGVTPLQMVTAVSSVANGGELVQPRVVRAVIRDGHRTPVPRKVVRRTITPSTAAVLTRIMEGVVEQGGTATRASIDGYTVAGKTGTAQKLVNGRYSRTDYNTSFVGFVPSRKPVFTIVVVVDTPRVYRYGGLVAAPIFKRIAEAALRHHGVPRTINAPPPVLVARREVPPEVPTSAPIDNPAMLTVVDAGSPSSGLPDLKGMSAREAARALARLGLTARMHGTGIVSHQRPEPGTPINARTTCELWLVRQPVVIDPPQADAPAGKTPNGTHP